MANGTYEDTFDEEPSDEEWGYAASLREERQGESRVQHLREMAKEQLKKKVKQEIKKQLAKKAAQQGAKQAAAAGAGPIFGAIGAVAPWVLLGLAIVFVVVFIVAVVWYAGVETVCTGGTNITGGIWHATGELAKKIPIFGGTAETILDLPELTTDLTGDFIEMVNPLCYLLKEI